LPSMLLLSSRFPYTTLFRSTALPAISDKLDFVSCFSSRMFSVKSAGRPDPGHPDFAGIFPHAGGHQENEKSDIYGGPSVFVKIRPFRGRQNCPCAGSGTRAVLAVLRTGREVKRYSSERSRH